MGGAMPRRQTVPSHSAAEREAKVDAFVARFVGRETYPAGEAHYVNEDGVLRSVSVGGEGVPRPSGSVRLVIVSDTHEKHDLLSMPQGDVLLHCGDFLMVNSGYSAETTSRKLREFNDWLGKLSYKEKVVIAGNHDAGVQAMGRRAIASALTNCTYIENEHRTLECGLRVFGTPASTSNSAKSVNHAFQYTEEELDEIFVGSIPREGVDVLMTHGPPQTLPAAERYLESHPVPLSVWGHVHEEHGASWRRGGVAINAATMGRRFSPTNAPIIFDLRPQSPKSRSRL